MSSSGGLVEWLYARINELFSWLLSLGASGKLNWVAQYWKTFVLVIVLLGVLIDITIYVVRYRPDIKWRRRIHRWLKRGGARERSPRESTPRGERVKKESAAIPPPQRARVQDKPATRERAAHPDPERTRPAPIDSERTRPAPPPEERQKVTPVAAERYQPAPPLDNYDDEPRTNEPDKTTRKP